MLNNKLQQVQNDENNLQSELLKNKKVCLAIGIDIMLLLIMYSNNNWLSEWYVNLLIELYFLAIELIRK